MSGPAPVEQVKARLRQELLARRREYSDHEIADRRAAVRAVVLAREQSDRAAGRPWRRVAGYTPLRTEPGSIELLEVLAERGIEVIVPLVLPDKDLDWVIWAEVGDPAATPVRLGPAAITAADLVLVPALAVDRHGVRLGRGGGSYDRALSRVRPGVLAAALLYDDEVVATDLPAQPWDRPVQLAFTPGGMHELDRG